jgi:hypothetical protein
MRAYFTVWSLVLACLPVFGLPLGVSAAKPEVVGPIHDEGNVEFADCGSLLILIVRVKPL